MQILVHQPLVVAIKMAAVAKASIAFLIITTTVLGRMEGDILG